MKDRYRQRWGRALRLARRAPAVTTALPRALSRSPAVAADALVTGFLFGKGSPPDGRLPVGVGFRDAAQLNPCRLSCPASREPTLTSRRPSHGRSSQTKGSQQRECLPPRAPGRCPRKGGGDGRKERTLMGARQGTPHTKTDIFVPGTAVGGILYAFHPRFIFSHTFFHLPSYMVVAQNRGH